MKVAKVLLGLMLLVVLKGYTATPVDAPQPMAGVSPVRELVQVDKQVEVTDLGTTLVDRYEVIEEGKKTGVVVYRQKDEYESQRLVKRSARMVLYPVQGSVKMKVMIMRGKMVHFMYYEQSGDVMVLQKHVKLKEGENG